MEMRYIGILLTLLLSASLFVSSSLVASSLDNSLLSDGERSVDSTELPSHASYEHHRRRSESLSDAATAAASSSSTSSGGSSRGTPSVVSHHARMLRNVARLRNVRRPDSDNNEYPDDSEHSEVTLMDANARRNMKSTFAQPSHSFESSDSSPASSFSSSSSPVHHTTHKQSLKPPLPPGQSIPGSEQQLDLDALIPPGYDKLMPPKENGKPTKVRFHVWVLGLDSINEGSMTYVADIFMSQSWKDSRLVIPPDIAFNVNTSENPRGPYRLLPLALIDRIWRPDSFFKNAKEVTFQEMTIPNHYIWLYADHTILYMVKLSLLLSCAMKFQSYPHDTQNCSMKIESLSYTANDLIFDWEETDALVVEDHIELPQHDLIYRDIDYCTTIYSSGTFSCVQVNFTIKRRLGYYIFHTYIPTCLIVIMSWISFWIRPEAVPARVTLCVTSLLTMSTQHAQSQKSLPPVSYIKAIDIFMSSCTVFVFASLMEYALVNILMSDDPMTHTWNGSPLPVATQTTAGTSGSSFDHSESLDNRKCEEPCCSAASFESEHLPLRHHRSHQHHHHHPHHHQHETPHRSLSGNSGLPPPPPPSSSSTCSSLATSINGNSLASAPWIDCDTDDMENHAPLTMPFGSQVPVPTPNVQHSQLEQNPHFHSSNAQQQPQQQQSQQPTQQLFQPRTLQFQRKNNQKSHCHSHRSMIHFDHFPHSHHPSQRSQKTTTSPTNVHHRKSTPPIDGGVRLGMNTHSLSPTRRRHHVNGGNCLADTATTANDSTTIKSALINNKQKSNVIRLRRLSHSWGLFGVLNRTENSDDNDNNNNNSQSNNKNNNSSSSQCLKSNPQRASNMTKQEFDRSSRACPIHSGTTTTVKSVSPSSPSHSEFWQQRMRAQSFSTGLYMHHQQHHRALFVDKVSRWIFPLSFIVLNVLYWTYYLELLHSVLPSTLAVKLPSLFPH